MQLCDATTGRTAVPRLRPFHGPSVTFSPHLSSPLKGAAWGPRHVRPGLLPGDPPVCTVPRAAGTLMATPPR